MALDSTFMTRVRAVPWESYAGSCGNWTDLVPDLFARLVAGGPSDALAAASSLWNVLSHQGNAAPVAVPALPFLLESLDVVTDELVVEVLDILACFAGCVRWHRQHSPPGGMPTWVTELWSGLVAEHGRFLRLSEHRNEDIAGYAQDVAELGNPDWLGQGVRGWGP